MAMVVSRVTAGSSGLWPRARSMVPVVTTLVGWPTMPVGRGAGEEGAPFWPGAGCAEVAPFDDWPEPADDAAVPAGPWFANGVFEPDGTVVEGTAPGTPMAGAVGPATVPRSGEVPGVPSRRVTPPATITTAAATSAARPHRPPGTIERT